MSFKTTEKVWIPPTKGEYCPPPKEIYKNVICKTINTSNYIDRNISHFIGKDGKNFIELTNRFDVLYIFYKDRQIEVWGEDPTNVHNVIHYFIDKIKKMNQKRQERYEMANTVPSIDQTEPSTPLEMSTPTETSEPIEVSEVENSSMNH